MKRKPARYIKGRTTPAELEEAISGVMEILEKLATTVYTDKLEALRAANKVQREELIQLKEESICHEHNQVIQQLLAYVKEGGQIQ
ncbi:MAG: hypothetical protein WBQ69_05915 [Gallionella sp.]